MDLKEALELAIRTLNRIPNTKTAEGTTYEIISRLEKSLKENKEIGYPWNIEDIIVHGRVLNIEISLEEAEEIGYNITENFNADIGLNWDIITTNIREYFNSKNA